jgi:carbon-monoxide dehydrogenase medium subunit
LLALEASVKLLSPGGERTLPLNDFFIGPHQTAQMADELLTAILLPALPPGAVGIYLRYSLRNAVNPAIVSVAVLAAPGGTVRIALGAAEPKPVRAYQAEQQAGPLTEEAILAAAALVADTAHPIDDIRASAEYRRAMLKLFTERALRQAKNMLHEKKEA